MIRHRTMSLDDLRLVLDWAAQEGWNPGLDDAEAFLSADPDGFFLAEDDDTPVAAISVVNHSADYAFLGLYLCHPDYRGRGIAYALWNHALDHAGPRTVGLDGVPAQQTNYMRSGFVHAGATRRFAGDISPGAATDLRPVEETDIPTLIDAEAHISGARKGRFLQAWFTDTKTRRTIIADRSAKGFATVRRCRDGAKIGPLVTDDIDAARDLLSAAANIFPGPSYIDVPDSSPDLADLCRAEGMDVTFETARMYRGTPIASQPGIFAVSTLELG